MPWTMWSNTRLFWATVQRSQLCHVATRPLLNPQGRRQQLRRSDKIPTTDILDAHISTTIQQFNETGIYDFVRASCNLVLADDDASTAAGVILTITYNVTTSRASAVILGVQEGIISPPSRFANFIAIPGTSKAHNVTTSKQWVRILTLLSKCSGTFHCFCFSSSLPTGGRIVPHTYPTSIVFGHHSMFETWKAAVAQIADIQGLYPTFVSTCPPPAPLLWQRPTRSVIPGVFLRSRSSVSAVRFLMSIPFHPEH